MTASTPHLVVRGNPTDAELAAVVAAVLATARTRAAQRPPAGPGTRSGWSAHWRSVRGPVPMDWRQSGLPS